MKLVGIIKAALDNGYQPIEGVDPEYLTPYVKDNRIVFHYTGFSPSIPLVEKSVYGLLFEHPFAKIVWSKQDIDLGKVKDSGLSENMRIHGCPAWHWHLQQMVLEQDPIKYLEEHYEQPKA